MADSDVEAGESSQPQAMETEKGDLQKAAGKGGPIAALPATLCGLGQVVYLSIATVALIFFVIVLPVVLTLPQVVSCHPDDESYYVVLIAEPTIVNVEPSMICIADSDRKVNVTGGAFLNYNGAIPSVMVNNVSLPIMGAMRGCSTVDVRKQDVHLCTEFDVIIPNATNLTNFSYFPFVLTDPVPPKEHPLADVTGKAPCEVLAKGLLTVVPPPAIVDVFPPVICNATTMITISGEWFPTFTLNATQVTSKPLVELNGNLAPATDLSLKSCVGFDAHNYVNCSLCNSIEMAVNPSSFTINAAVNVSLTTPSPLNCSVPRTNNFVVVARPSLQFVSPNLVCNDGVNASVITLSGANFLKLDGKHANYSLTVTNQTYPLSVVGDAGCNIISIPMSSHNASLCSNVIVSIPPFAAPIGLSAASISVVTPSTPECGVIFASMLYFAPKPTIANIDPQSVCQGTQSNTTDTNLTIHAVGSAFLRFNSVNPTIELNGASFLGPQAIANCSANINVPSSSGVDSVQTCDSITIGLSYAEIEAMAMGGQSFKITQPPPISCSHTDTSSFTVVGPAKVNSIDPSSLCAGEQNVLILNGSSLTPNTSISLIMGNTTLYPTLQTYIDSTTLSVVFDSAGLIEGTWQLRAVNMEVGCAIPSLSTLTVKPKMFVFFVDPPVVYNGLQLQATVYTSGTDNSNPASSLTFTRLNSGAGVCSNPSFTSQAACTAVYTNASCSNSLLLNQTQCEAVNTWNGTNCSNPLLLTQADCIKINLWTAGFCSDPLLNVSQCSQNNTWTFYAIGSCSNPMFTTATTCQQQNIWLGTKCSNLLLTNQTDCETVNTWTFYPPGSCFGNASLAFEQCASANLTWNSSNTTETYTSMTFNSSVLVQKGSKIQVVIPAGFSVGDWEITVFRSDGCQSSLEGGVNVVANTVLSLESVDPTRAWSLGNTAVTIKATATASLLAGQVNFRSTPRVFLAPSGQVGTCANSTGSIISNSTTQANCLSLNGTFTQTSVLGVSLAALVYADSSTLQGVIQSHFCSGPYTTQAACINASETWTELVVGASYNLIVINPPPLSEVGVLPNAVVVVANPPPIVRGVAPDYVPSGVNTVNVYGENFLYPATATITCNNRTYIANSTSLMGVSSTQFNVTFSFPTGGSVCLFQVTNSDGSSFVYSSITTMSGGGNIQPFVSSSYALIQPRRGPEIVVASPSITQKFMYVIGGDSGADPFAAPLAGSGTSMVEYVPLQFDGTPATAFIQQRYPLPAPVSHGRAAVIGRFIYYFGGYNTNTSATSNAVYRAQILDPLNAPTLQLSLNILANVSSNLTSGLWYYRVAAVFSNSSTTEYEFWSGPMGSGETSASEALSIRLPVLANMQLSLTWNPFPGASEYRLYRSPVANRPAGQLGLLYQGPQTNFQDLGFPVDLTQTPVPLGHLSHWAVLSTPLAQPRARAGLVLVPPTPSNPDQSCAFIVGGATSWSDASALNTIERYCATVSKALSVTATEKHTLQTMGSAYTATSSANNLTVGWGFDAALVTPIENAYLAPTQRKLFLSTRLPNNAEGTQVWTVEVTQNATLVNGSYTAAANVNGLRHGGFFSSVGGEAFGIGGVKVTGGPGTVAIDGVSGSWGTPTTTSPWNNYGGGKLVQANAYFGKVKFGPFLLVAGGCNAVAPVSTVQSSYCCI